MNIPTLRTICIEYHYRSLLLGMWKHCLENPFSYMPPSVVEELLSLMLPADLMNRDRIVLSFPLLTSGRLRHVDLFRARDTQDYCRLFQMLSLGCQNVQSLSLPRCFPEFDVNRVRYENSIHQKLFKNCTNLEELHSRTVFDPHCLENCSKLRTLKLHWNREEVANLSRSLSSHTLYRLPSVSVFALCKKIDTFVEGDKDSVLSLAVKLLHKCPKLTSMGFLDSLVALKELYDKDLRIRATPHTFQLRRCYWAPSRDPGQFVFCEMIRVAVSLCPLLEALAIRVRGAGSLNHLKALRHLTSLDINFDICEDNYEQEFYSLLHEVGPQLQSLSVPGGWRKLHSLSLISDSCPNLSSLRLGCNISAGEPAQPNASFLHLKRLSVFKCDRECLFSLLSNCARLKVMCLNHCQALEDGVLRKILRKNSFPELEVAYLRATSLSKSGLTKFVQCAGNLKKFSLGSLVLSDRYGDMEIFSNLNPGVELGASSDYAELEREEFPRECWL